MTTETIHIVTARPVEWRVAETTPEPDCPDCGDYGRIGRHRGQVVYCACRAGIAAELEDRDRVLSILADQIEAAPKFDKAYRRALWAHFETLKDEYDALEKSLYAREAVTA